MPGGRQCTNLRSVLWHCRLRLNFISANKCSHSFVGIGVVLKTTNRLYGIGVVGKRGQLVSRREMGESLKYVLR
jgi:hypothetical protein